MKVVFVGLGAMGLPMAHNLVVQGFDVIGVDPDPERRESARPGLRTVASVAECPGADLVIVMVAHDGQLAGVLSDAPEPLQSAVWVLMGTLGVDAVVAAQQRLGQRGGSVVDAPVTGGQAGARNVTMLIMVGGAPDLVEQVRPVLAHLGRVIQVGEKVGDGQAMKTVNQLLCSVHLVAAGEALALAGRLGIDGELALEVLTSGGANSWMLTDRGPRMLGEPPVPPKSTIDIFVKDSGLAVAAANSVGMAAPVLQAAHDQFVRASQAGLGDVDDSVVISNYR
ncbi:MAG: NAD(P)-dependent oxidoreductase [Brooklawnia sp.]|uniref:NAD(P)-dependent oxidoreductase n=1 Tax=Brooklawnia sp. TaxID=2699740 RepID=UPI003C770E23